MYKYLLCFIALTATARLTAQSSVGILTMDGAWCWFSDPRAILTTKGRVITGWVKKDGSVEAAELDPENHSVSTRILYDRLEVDDHDNPAFAELPDGQILAMYTWHGSKKGIIWHKTGVPGNITSFSEPVIIRPGIETLLHEFPRETYTYANPYYLSDEKAIYTFGRWIGFKPNMIRSFDGGQTWQDEKVIISSTPFDGNNRPYVKYASDGQSRIHLVFTDGHPEVEPENSVYHCYYESGAFWRSDGSKICTVEQLPFRPEDATLVYKPKNSSGLAWLADMGIDRKGRPVILYTRHPQKTDHRYHYAWYDQKRSTWNDNEICKAGKWFPQTPEGVRERESYYHGNMSLQPDRPEVVFLSRQINDRFEIEKRRTRDGGKSWRITPITSNSTYDQVRPYVARGTGSGQKTIVLWMENRRYIHYTDYDTSIKYWLDSRKRGRP